MSESEVKEGKSAAWRCSPRGAPTDAAAPVLSHPVAPIHQREVHAGVGDGLPDLRRWCSTSGEDGGWVEGDV